MILDSINNGTLVYPTVEDNGQTRPKKYSELTEAQKIQDECDVQATNIIFHSLPSDVYALVNHQEAAKDIWDRVNLLMKGTELSYQERECRLYNLFNKFAYVQAPIYHQRHHTPVNPQEQSVSPQPFISPSVTQHSQADFPQLDSGLAVPTFHQGEDPIECINKAMASYLLWHQGFHLQTINSEHLPIPRIRQLFKMVESQFNKFKEDNVRVLLALEIKELLQL
ncbi:hypothetical protein Tco_1129539 [Tanacetum coccineum]